MHNSATFLKVDRKETNIYIDLGILLELASLENS
jgi:hypothetical protein